MSSKKGGPGRIILHRFAQRDRLFHIHLAHQIDSMPKVLTTTSLTATPAKRAIAFLQSENRGTVLRLEMP